jgi:endo-alpha-1,4-polygalactosaminidase (GH114 family)
MNELQLHHNDIFDNVAQYTEEYFNKLYVIVAENDPMKIESEYYNFLRETTIYGIYYDLVDGFEYVEDEVEFNYDLVKDKEFKSVSNLRKYNNKLVIIDYEHTGISQFQPNIRDYCRKNCINNSSL